MFKEHPVFITVPFASTPISRPVVDLHPIATTNDEPIEDVDPIALDVDIVALNVVMDIPLRRSDPTTYKEEIVSHQSNFWINVLKDEMISMSRNKVWSFIDFPDGFRPIGCE